MAFALSPDGQYVLMSPGEGPYTRLMLVPTGPGEARALPAGKIAGYRQAIFLPDGKHVVVGGYEEGRRQALYVQDLDGGEPRALVTGGYGIACRAPSPDGKLIIASNPLGLSDIVSTDGSVPPRTLLLPAGYHVLQWLPGGTHVLLFTDHLPIELADFDLETQKSFRSGSLPPVGDQGGELRPDAVMASADRRHFSINMVQLLGDLYVVSNVK
jgi:hypothetical protein